MSIEHFSDKHQPKFFEKTRASELEQAKPNKLAYMKAEPDPKAEPVSIHEGRTRTRAIYSIIV